MKQTCKRTKRVVRHWRCLIYWHPLAVACKRGLSEELHTVVIVRVIVIVIVIVMVIVMVIV